MADRLITTQDVEMALNRTIGNPAPGAPGKIVIQGHAAGGPIRSLSSPRGGNEHGDYTETRAPSTLRMNMRLNYDIAADALDVRFVDGLVTRTEEIDAGTLVDVDQLGRLLAIEVLSPARPWPLEEILERFPDVDEEDAALLRALRGQSVKFTLSTSLVPA